MAQYSSSEVILGGVVLATAVGFFAFASQSAGLFGSTSGYELNASFRSIEGISLGSDVRLAGVKVGSVTGLELDPQTFRATTTFRINEGIEIPDDSAVIVASEGLLGGSFVEIQPGGSPFGVEPGGEIEDTQSAVSLVSLLLKFVAGGGSE
ncbi:MAG: outer membrane lipid asymmetry maintenance protein MlaD [Pseudomonadota bacterium]